MARVVQISDTHLSPIRAYNQSTMRAVLAWLQADPPDLVVHTGDIVIDDPDDVADRSFAHDLMTRIPSRWVVIPGNHDVGDVTQHADRARRVDAFRATWGGDRFCVDIDGWRLVGIDVYLLGDDDHDTWLTRSLSGRRPTVVFAHQPISHPRPGDWGLPAGAQQAFERATSGADIRVIASGHLHRYDTNHHDERGWQWIGCPSLTIGGRRWDDGSDPRCGLVEHVIEGASLDHRLVRPRGIVDVFLDELDLENDGLSSGPLEPWQGTR